MVYLVKCASYTRGKAYYKIGFTSDLEHRLPQYITHNPTIQVLETVNTYSKTKRKLETALHNELLKNGHKFEIVYNIETEWFECDNNSVSLKNFKSCQNHKVVVL